MMKNTNSSKGAKTSGIHGGIRSPTVGFLATNKMKLNPSIAANTTTPGIAKASAPIRTPANNGKIVKYSR